MLTLNYLIQARNEGVIKYPTINKNCIDFFDHLLFTNGNGYELMDGNFVNYFSPFGRLVYWKDYYKNYIAIEDMIELYNRNQEYCDEPKYYTIEQFTEIKEGDLTSKDFWYNCILSKEYFSYLHSCKYSKIMHFNTSTDKILIHTSLAICLAYKKFYNEVIEDNSIFDNFKDPYLRGGFHLNIVVRDLELVNERIVFLTKRV